MYGEGVIEIWLGIEGVLRGLGICRKVKGHAKR